MGVYLNVMYWPLDIAVKFTAAAASIKMESPEPLKAGFYDIMKRVISSYYS